MMMTENFSSDDDDIDGIDIGGRICRGNDIDDIDI